MLKTFSNNILDQKFQILLTKAQKWEEIEERIESIMYFSTYMWSENS